MSYNMGYVLIFFLFVSWPLYQGGRDLVFFCLPFSPHCLKEFLPCSRPQKILAEQSEGMGGGEQKKIELSWKKWACVWRREGCVWLEAQRAGRAPGSPIKLAWWEHNVVERNCLLTKGSCSSLQTQSGCREGGTTFPSPVTVRDSMWQSPSQWSVSGIRVMPSKLDP